MLSMRIRVYFMEITIFLSIMLQLFVLLSISVSGGKLEIFNIFFFSVLMKYAL